MQNKENYLETLNKLYLELSQIATVKTDSVRRADQAFELKLAIAARKGADTAWDRFAASIERMGKALAKLRRELTEFCHLTRSHMSIIENLDLVFQRAKMRLDAQVEMSAAIYKLSLGGGKWYEY